MGLKIWVVIVFFIAVNFGISSACPDKEYRFPCTCYGLRSLKCLDICDVDALKTLAENMEGVDNFITKLFIENSTLQYLPAEIVQTFKLKELHVKNVTLQKLFIEPPTTQNHFKAVTLEDVRLLCGVKWSVFSRMETLETITIKNISVTVLRKEFGENVRHKLKRLEFWQTKTKKIETDALQNFKDLEVLTMYDCKIEELHRNYFPVPFNVEYLNFSFNKLRTIPADLFTNMPNLVDVRLANNQIATIPESAFGGRYNHIDMLLLRDNPLKCDCNLRWIVMAKKYNLYGTCSSPKIMHGKELKHLQYEDFVCI